MAETNSQLTRFAPASQRPVPIARCPKCSAEIGDDAEFCHKCGSSILRCPQCGSPRMSDAVFCDRCSAIRTPSPMVTTATAATVKQANIPENAHPLFGQMTQMFGLHPIVTFA